jgi:membrane associated rhomboid family serine protease
MSFTPLVDGFINSMVLDGWSIFGIVGYSFLHADIFHLIGNMILLWVFGNTICSKIGAGYYLVLFVGFGIISAIGHNIFDGTPAVGASGAIYGILGFYFSLYPTNKISCFWWIFIRAGTVEISAYLLVGFWVLQDIFGVIGGDSNIAHTAHLAGFLAGLALGFWLIRNGRIAMNDFDLKTLSDFV